MSGANVKDTRWCPMLKTFADLTLDAAATKGKGMSDPNTAVVGIIACSEAAGCAEKQLDCKYSRGSKSQTDPFNKFANQAGGCGTGRKAM